MSLNALVSSTLTFGLDFGEAGEEHKQRDKNGRLEEGMRSYGNLKKLCEPPYQEGSWLLLFFKINQTLRILSLCVFTAFQFMPFRGKHKAAYLWGQQGSQPYFKTEV